MVTGTDSKVVFDTPLSANRLQQELAGADMAILGHVHEDHTCGLHLLPDAEVFAPEADVAALRSMEGMMAHYGYAPQTLAAMVPHIVDDFYFQPRPDAQGSSKVIESSASIRALGRYVRKCLPQRDMSP